jgi:DNA adenine methylase
MQLMLELPSVTLPDRAADEISSRHLAKPFKQQLLKWIGNKQRFAHEIISFFPERFGTYHEPFLGSGGVLATLAPARAEASDSFEPLIEIWTTLKSNPHTVKDWYAKRWMEFKRGAKSKRYEAIKKRYNDSPNGADLLFLCRSCYGGVVRFRMRDGYMSTPVGAHDPISPSAFAARVDAWAPRIQGTTFRLRDYTEAIERARTGDVIYCDPPYSYSQAILYGAQRFSLDELFRSIRAAKSRGVFIALSIDGSKKSGALACPVKIPRGLFAREARVNVGRSMLRRFQMSGRSLESESVTDRLLLTH